MPGAPPPDIECPVEVLDIAFHPEHDIVASCLIDGRVFVHEYAESGCTIQAELKNHKESVRTLTFSDDGGILYAGSKDCSFSCVDVTTGAVTWRCEDAHDDGINAMIETNPGILATGDDDGVIRIWDTRQKTRAFDFPDAHSDFISALWHDDRHPNDLLATSGDGCLSYFHFRRGTIEPTKTDSQDDELLSLAVIKDGNKVVCGSQCGILHIFDYGEWIDPVDKFVGHPDSIESILPLDEHTLVTGSIDGMIRVVQVRPNKLLGVLGEHEDMPIERLAFSRDKVILASTSHDRCVKFWDTSILRDDDDGDGDSDSSGGGDDGDSDGDSDSDGNPRGAGDRMEEDTKVTKGQKKGKAKKGQIPQDPSFFDGL